MLINGLAHVTSDGLWIDKKRDARLDTLLRQMDEAGAHYSVLTALPGKISDEFTAEACRRHPRRLIGVGCPSLTAPAAAEMRRIKDLGLVGIKLHPRLGGFRLEDTRLDRLIDAAAEARLLVMVCGIVEARGWSGGKLPHEAVGEWADLHPHHPFILVHGGSQRILDAWAMARVRDNVYLDLSHSLTYFAGSSVEQDIGFVAQRLGWRTLFGCDFPEASIAEGLLALERCMATFPNWDRARVLGGNWLEILSKLGVTPA